MEKVQNALKDFQHRMNQRTLETMKAAALEGPATAAQQEGKRGREFGDQLTKKREVSHPAPAVSSASSITGATARRGAGGQGAPRSAMVQGTGNKAGFAIFCDDGESSADTPGGGFGTLPSEKEKSKENTRAASKWNQETIPQERRRVPRAVAGGQAAAKAGVDFELFVDADLAEAQERAEPAEKQPVRLQLDGSTAARRDAEASSRQQRPLDFLSAPGPDGTASAQQEPGDAPAPDFRRPPSSSTRAPMEGGAGEGASKRAAGCKQNKAQQQKLDGKVHDRRANDSRTRNPSADGTGVAAYDRAMLVHDGEELCPEEARALARYGRQALLGSLAFDGEHSDGGAAAGSRASHNHSLAPSSTVSLQSAKDDDVDMLTKAKRERRRKSVAFCDAPEERQKQETEDEEGVDDEEGGAAGDRTLPSPTFSKFAPSCSSLLRPQADVPSASGGPMPRVLSDLVAADEASSMESKQPKTPFTRQTCGTTSFEPPDDVQADEAPPQTCTKAFGGDLSMISRAANSTFFANSSRTTLCPSTDANFTLHEETSKLATSRVLQAVDAGLDSHEFSLHHAEQGSFRSPADQAEPTAFAVPGPSGFVVREDTQIKDACAQDKPGQFFDNLGSSPTVMSV